MVEKRLSRYEDLSCRMIELIASGAYKPGERLPSIRELAERFQVSVNTVREAYALLENRRYVEAVPQSGYFVADRLPVESLSVQNPAAMDPHWFSICSIYTALQKTGTVAEDSCGLAIATLSSSLWPTDKIQKYTVDAIRLRPADSIDYQMSPGYGPLREQIAIHGLSSGTRLPPDRIVVTSGCQEAIYLALSAVVAPGDTVAVESPVYFNMLDMLDRLHVTILEIPCSSVDGMNLDTLEFALDHHGVTAVLTISNFNNPTGSLMPDAKKARLVHMLSYRGIPLIEDDVYGDLMFSADGTERPRSCKSFDTEGMVLYCSSFSKTISPGLRIGWIEPGKWHAEVEKMKTIINLGASSLPQVSTALFLQDGGFTRHLRRLRARLSSNMASLRASVLEHFPEGTTVTDPAGGMVLWVSLPGKAASMELYRRGLERNILIAPGRVFSLENKFESQFRLNAGVWESGTDDAITTLGTFAKELYR